MPWVLKQALVLRNYLNYNPLLKFFSLVRWSALGKGHDAIDTMVNFVNCLSLCFPKKLMAIQPLCLIVSWRYILHEQLVCRDKILRPKHQSNLTVFISLIRRVARISQNGGAFLKGENNSKRTWPKSSSVLNEIETVFLSKSGDFQKKKVFTKIQSLFLTNFGCAPEKQNLTFMVQITASPSQLLLPNSVGGAVFIFGAKFDLKSTKNVLFCILFPAHSDYATEFNRFAC